MSDLRRPPHPDGEGTRTPTFRDDYLDSSASICPFCESDGLFAGPPEADGTVAWAAVECPDCGHTWQDVWTLVDMVDIRDRDGKEVASDSIEEYA